MTKRRKRKTKRRSRKKSRGFSTRGLLIILIILGALLFGNRADLIDINWQALNNGDLGQAISITQTGDESLENVQETLNINVDEEVLNTISQKVLETAEDVLENENLSNIISTSPQTPVVVEPVSGEWYHLYFTSPQYPDEPETRVYTVPNSLIDIINNTQQSLDIAIYELNLDEIGEAILAARNRGVNVRLVTDTDELEELETLMWLEREGIPIVSDERSPIMHHKFMVVDGEAVWTGSWNFTSNGTFRNNNHAIYIQSPEMAQNYATEFDEMFTQHAFGPTSPANTPYPQIQISDTLIETCFAPEDRCDEKLMGLINQAQQSIRFMIFSFTHDGIGHAIREKAKAGVEVQGVFETRGSETEYSEFGRMKNQGLDVVQDGNPYTLHHKAVIIDDRIVALGSFNFSANATESNDENLIIIHNPEITQQFLEEFNRVYQQALTPPS